MKLTVISFPKSVHLDPAIINEKSTTNDNGLSSIDEFPIIFGIFNSPSFSNIIS